MQSSYKNFGRSTIMCVRFGIFWTVVVYLMLIGARWLTNAPHIFPGTKPLMVLLPGFSAIAVITSWFYALGAGMDGLRIRGWSGKMTDIPWSHIKDVTAISLAGLRLLKVTYEGNERPGLLPLWISDGTEFIETCRANAGNDHVLVRWLDSHREVVGVRFYF